MTHKLILASSSAIRAQMLQNAGLAFDIVPARIDEEAVRAAVQAEGGSARDLADMLAELKAQKISDRMPGALVLGADQVLECEGRIFAKAETLEEAADHLRFLSGKVHRLLSAAVVCLDGRPLWRHVGTVRMTMRPLSETWIDDYLSRTWSEVRHSVGCYLIEREGVQLFAHIEGDFFNILGLPLIELLTWLRIRGDIPS